MTDALDRIADLLDAARRGLGPTLQPTPETIDEPRSWSGPVPRFGTRAGSDNLGREMAILPHDQILCVHTALVATRLTGSRTALLGGIPPALVDTLPTAADPSSQILSDLHRLNVTERLADGTVPLKSMLENAMALSISYQDSDVIREALEAIVGGVVKQASKSFDNGKAVEAKSGQHLPATTTSAHPLRAPAAIIRDCFSDERRTDLRLIRTTPFRIGRSDQMDYTIEKSEISRCHAIIARIGDSFFIADNQSSCGTVINGLPISEFKLRHGDELDFTGGDRIWPNLYFCLYADPADALVEVEKNDSLPACRELDKPTSPRALRADCDHDVDVVSAVRRIMSRDPRCSIFLVSVDCFGAIIRFHGRQVGRTVLMALAKALSYGLSSDMLLAGAGFPVSEIGVVAPGIYSQVEADRQIQTIYDLIPKYVPISSALKVQFTVTVGWAPMDIESARKALEESRAAERKGSAP